MIARKLYDQTLQPIGTAFLHRKNATVEVKFDHDRTYNGNARMDVNEYKAYKRRMQLKDENEVERMEGTTWTTRTTN